MIKSKRRGKPLSANLVARWHPTLNGDLRPEDVSGGSEVIIKWVHYDQKRKEVHIWPASPMAMSRAGMCMICTGRYLAVGVNDLATRNPKVAHMWHPTMNDDLTPQMFTEHAPEKVWWRHYDRKTRKWHEWPARIGHLTRRKPNKCAICSGQRIQIGVNDLATTHPELASEWHPTRNKKLTPQMVSKGSSEEAWWLRDCHNNGIFHEWHSRVSKRAGKKPRGCAICRGYQVQKGINDLASQYPEIAKEWDYVKNKNMRPNSIVEHSGEKVAWKHYHKSKREWHGWSSRVADRTGRIPKGCPDCSKTGFDPTLPGDVYVLFGIISEFPVIQFGISNDVKTRLITHTRSGFRNTPITLVSFTEGSQARTLERSLINLMKDYDILSCNQKGIKFDGSTEAFCLEDADEEFLEDFMELVRL